MLFCICLKSQDEMLTVKPISAFGSGILNPPGLSECALDIKSYYL